LKLLLNLNIIILKIKNIVFVDMLILSVKFMLKILDYCNFNIFNNNKNINKIFLKYFNYKKKKLPIFKILNFLKYNNIDSLLLIFNKILSIKILLCIEILKYTNQINYCDSFFSLIFKKKYLKIKEKILTSKILKTKQIVDVENYLLSIPYGVKTIMVNIKNKKKTNELVIKNKKSNLNYLSVYKWIYILNKIVYLFFKFKYVIKHNKNFFTKYKIQINNRKNEKVYSSILKKLTYLLQKIIEKPMFLIVTKKSNFYTLSEKTYKNQQKKFKIKKKIIKEIKKKYFYKNLYNNLQVVGIRNKNYYNIVRIKNKNFNMFLINYLKLKIKELTVPNINPFFLRKKSLIEN
jgi:hypothetical protein